MNEGQMGVGFLLHAVFGDNKSTAEAYTAAQGKTIAALTLDPDDGDGGALHMLFTDGTGIKARDDARSCCEERYMHTDDDLNAFVGAVFTDMELRDAPGVETDYDQHDVQFLLVNTSLGTFTMETHNIHNGYYAGFWIVIEPWSPAD